MAQAAQVESFPDLDHARHLLAVFEEVSVAIIKKATSRRFCYLERPLFYDKRVTKTIPEKGAECKKMFAAADAQRAGQRTRDLVKIRLIGKRKRYF